MPTLPKCGGTGQGSSTGATRAHLVSRKKNEYRVYADEQITFSPDDVCVSHTANLTDSSIQFSFTGSHRPLASSGHVTASRQVIGLPIFPV